MIFRNILLFIALSLSSAVQAQISYGGKPLAFDNPDRLHDISTVEVAPENLEALRAEDAINDQYKDIPYRFGANMAVDLGLEEGVWQEFDDGSRAWRLGVSSPGAVSINFNFSTFQVPEGAKVFVYDADRTHFIGAFTHQNMKPHGGLGVSLIQSDAIIIEYLEPASVNGEVALEIDNITHGYRSILHKFDELRGPFGNSGSCNIDVVCDEGIGWEDQIRSVALIVVGGNASCTGSLVNNTAEDGTPYFLTANHCLGGNVGNWTFYFNHQAPTCGANNGPTNQSISGAELKASNGGSDFALLELSEDPPQAFDVFFNGWDRSGDTPTSLTGIHHPSGDLKKISHDFDSPSQQDQSGAAVWYLDQWEEGTTEGGSSGSPLFDQNNRVVGQLYGGYASCSNIDADWYGRFDVSWDGSSPSSRLRDWLDPVGSSPLVLDGLGGAPVLPLDASAFGISGVEEVLCNESVIEPLFTLRNNGLNTLTSAVLELELNGEDAGTINWTGSLENGDTEVIQLPEFVLIDGSNSISVNVVDPNGLTDGNANNNSSTFEFSAFIDAVEYNVTLVLDDYGSETTWYVENEDGDVLYSDGPYGAGGGWGSDGTDGQIEESDLCLGNGCYTFVIEDTADDGICCGYGEGSYTIYDQDGLELTSGGEFLSEDSFDFCVVTVSTAENELQEGFEIYPNPATNNVLLKLPELTTSSAMGMRVTDLTGRTVVQRELNNASDNRLDLNVASWAPGMYLVSLEQDGQTAVKRLVVTR